MNTTPSRPTASSSTSEVIYLDNNATTRVADEVIAAMEPYYRHYYGNAHSPHALGLRSHNALEDARAEVAALLHARQDEIYFTSCGTESNALVILGLVAERQSSGRRRIVATTVEHPSILSLLKDLESRGSIELSMIPVDRDGRLDVEAARSLIDDEALLVTVMLAQNETGVIHPVKEIAAIAQNHGARTLVDAVQCAGKIDVEPQSIGADFLSISGHKFHAPKGIGALYIRKGLTLPPLWRGGGQERGLRSGTEAVPLIVGLGAAATLARQHQWSADLRDTFEKKVLESCPGAVVNGAGVDRLPNTANVSFPAIFSGDIVAMLDWRGVCVSGGSACQSGKTEPTATMQAMGLPRDEAIGAVRFSLSRYTTAGEIERASDAVREVVHELAPQEVR
jgi:cysteine desulfurase